MDAARSAGGDGAPDGYAREIADLQREIDRLAEDRSDPDTQADLESQVRVLRAIYDRAQNLLERGHRDAVLRTRLAMRGYGEWDLDNVYAFVFERAVELEAPNHATFIGEIRDTDFASLLRGDLQA